MNKKVEFCPKSSFCLMNVVEKTKENLLILALNGFRNLDKKEEPIINNLLVDSERKEYSSIGMQHIMKYNHVNAKTAVKINKYINKDY